MMTPIVLQKLESYRPVDAIDQENALAEILQHYVLSSLARGGFFDVAGFHGGTFLRIVHRMNRFSEDLDFVLKDEDAGFIWQPYLERVEIDCAFDGIAVEVTDHSSRRGAVKKATIRATLASETRGALPLTRHPRQKVRIKLKVDADPPLGSTFETAYLGFPQLTMITVQTLESAFASKSHALLCRSFTKGRDWYDFLFYVSHRIRPHLVLLENALRQQGPWAGKMPTLTEKWYIDTLSEVIDATDWKDAVRDVQRFLSPRERETTQLWNRELFQYHMEQLAQYLRE